MLITIESKELFKTEFKLKFYKKFIKSLLESSDIKNQLNLNISLIENSLNDLLKDEKESLEYKLNKSLLLELKNMIK